MWIDDLGVKIQQLMLVRLRRKAERDERYYLAFMELDGFLVAVLRRHRIIIG